MDFNPHYSVVSQDFLSHGFHAQEIQADGKIHRFQRSPSDKKKNAWYVCFINNNIGFLAGSYGDWSTGEKYNFCTSPSISKDEKERVFKKIDHKFEEERSLVQEESATESLKFIQEFTTISGPLNEYLVRKKISKLHGALLSSSDLIIPVNDIDGKLWGYQRIDPEGAKRFSPGLKKKGNFFSIGSLDEDTLYFCEGFATGCSIREAIQKTVIVCFDTGNLDPVIRIFRERYPDKKFVICGDDDAFTENNPGRVYAENAAKSALASVVFPKFKSLFSKPTDFNDLHILEGLKTVADQILSIEAKIHFIHYLGYNKGSYFYRTSSNFEISRVTQHSEESLLNLMPLEYWESKYKKDGPIPWTKIKSDLMLACRKKGIYDKELVRGLGVWIDGGRIVVHLGNRLYYDGQEHDLTSLKSEYHYELSKTLPSIHPCPLKTEECGIFVQALNNLNYKSMHQRFFLGGWMATASLCGLLKWRPHLWLTGQTGSGKSEIRNRMVVPLIKGGLKALDFTGDSTEPGIRRTVLSHALPIIFDEVESDDEYANESVQRTLRYIRQASTEQEAQIVKAGHGSSTDCYSARFVALLSSVEANLRHQADKDRFTVIEIVREGQSNEQYEKFLKLCNWFTPENSQRFLARCIQLAPVLLKNQKTLQDTSVGSQRFGAQYGALLAGWSILVGDQEITKSEAEDLWKSIDWSESKEEMTDGEACLNHILSHILRLPEGEFSVRQIVNSNSLKLRGALEPYCIRILDNGRLFIAKDNPQVAKWFSQKGSKWIGEGKWYKTLMRNPGVEPSSRRPVSSEKTVRGLLIPEKYFKE